MSTKSKASGNTGGCCIKDATLIINFEWYMDVQPPAVLFPSCGGGGGGGGGGSGLS